MVTNAVSKITADYGHGEVHLEDISDLVANKCGAESILVDARRSTLAKSVLKVDATFPVFEKSEAPRVLRIEFDELPGAANRRKSRLADNGHFSRLYAIDVMLMGRRLPPFDHDRIPKFSQLHVNIHIIPFVARKIPQTRRRRHHSRRWRKQHSSVDRWPLPKIPILHACHLYGVPNTNGVSSLWLTTFLF